MNKVYIIGETVYRMLADGHLSDPSSWDEKFSKNLCNKFSINYERNEKHILLCRKYFSEFNITPLPKPFNNYCHRHGTVYNDVIAEFGTIDRLCLVSGLPRPWACGCR